MMLSLALLGSLLPLALGMAAPLKPTESATTIKLPEIPFKESSKASPLPAGSATRRIHPLGRDDLCVTVQGGELTVGAEAGIAYCEKQGVKADWQLWDVKAAQTTDKNGGQIKIVESRSNPPTTFCLGIGNDTQPGSRPRLETCLDTSTALAQGQAWGVTTDTLRNLRSDCQAGDSHTEECNLCFDIRRASPVFEGKTWSSVKDLQVWTCAKTTEINEQQKWSLMDPKGLLSGSTPDERSIRARGQGQV